MSTFQQKYKTFSKTKNKKQKQKNTNKKTPQFEGTEQTPESESDMARCWNYQSRNFLK